jgi:hypothetical protein
MYNNLRKIEIHYKSHIKRLKYETKIRHFFIASICLFCF